MATDRPDAVGSVTPPRRYRLDSTWRRVRRDTVLAGSPFRLFRLTDAGIEAVEAIERGVHLTTSTLVERLVDSGAIHPIAQSSSRFSLDDVTVVTPQLGGVPALDGRIVVDDGSMPPLTGATIRLHRNRGPGAARNAGRGAVDTSLIAFVDADVDIDAASSWLEPLLGHFDDPKVGLVSPRVTGGPNGPLDLGTEPARIRAGTRVSYVPAAAVVVRTAAFDAIGGFDAGLRFGEDVDLVWRLDDAGWRCRYEPASSVDHRPRSTFVARLRQHAGYGSSSAPLALRHPRRLAPARLSTWNAAAWGALASGHPIIGGATALVGAARLRSKLTNISSGEIARLAARSQLDNARQLTSAVRRVWWPIVAVASVVSHRARWIGALSLLASPRTAPDDLAYGWGVWSGMRRHRTIRPIVPAITPTS